jgi:hypothetical protein
MALKCARRIFSNQPLKNEKNQQVRNVCEKKKYFQLIYVQNASLTNLPLKRNRTHVSRKHFFFSQSIQFARLHHRAAEKRSFLSLAFFLNHKTITILFEARALCNKTKVGERASDSRGSEKKNFHTHAVDIIGIDE